MIKFLIMTMTLLILSACSTMQPARYSVSVDNIQSLKKYNGIKVRISQLTLTSDFDSNCRLMGPIEPADNMSFGPFISKAFNDEFKMAGIYGKDGINIHGEITNIEFSSSAGLTSGYWDIGLRLESSNNHSILVRNKYNFPSGFDAMTACNATADALTSAIQDLIKAAISHPKFEKLLKEIQ